MTATCKNCRSILVVEPDEDGAPCIDNAKCADPDCETYLCQAGCQELSFVCDACDQRFCATHPQFQADGATWCARCFLADEPVIRRYVLLAEAGCSAEEAAAFIGEVA